MFTREAIYTVHENREAKDPCERTIVVREGFSFWAFLFTVLWALANRLWLLSAFYLILSLLIYKSGPLLGFDEQARGILQLGLQVWLGFSAHDWQRDALARRGYTETGVVFAPNPWLAEQRHYDHQAA